MPNDRVGLECLLVNWFLDVNACTHVCTKTPYACSLIDTLADDILTYGRTYSLGGDATVILNIVISGPQLATNANIQINPRTPKISRSLVSPN
uniref:Uncharacterized protein n=1 Tax=Caenorhabditis japonica TaxID=281687 RepID=A0A8R1INV6_CAEJA